MNNGGSNGQVGRLRSVYKSFRSVREELRVLAGLDLDLYAGRSIAITGESGSGKSTMLNLIAGLDGADAGEIEVGGYAVHRLSEQALAGYRSRVVGLVFQFHYLLRDFTALENVIMPALMRGESRSEAEERGMHLLGEVGLAARSDHVPTELSGGERQRTALARALMNDPAVILADEPTGNLDAATSASVAELLMELTREHRKSLVLVTHERELAAACDERYELEDGRLSSW